MTVSLVLNLVASGTSADEITEAYPYLDAEDIRQALGYTTWMTEEGIHSPEQAATHKEGKVTEELNELYSDEPSRLDEGLEQIQMYSLPREDW